MYVYIIYVNEGTELYHMQIYAIGHTSICRYMYNIYKALHPYTDICYRLHPYMKIYV